MGTNMVYLKRIHECLEFVWAGFDVGKQTPSSNGAYGCVFG